MKNELDIDEEFTLILEGATGQGMPSDVTAVLIGCADRLKALAKACRETDAYATGLSEVAASRAEILDEWDPREHLYRAWMTLLMRFTEASGAMHQTIVRRYIPLVVGFIPE